MKLQKAIEHFENLKGESSKSSEIRVYEKFIRVLNSLENRGMSDSEVRSIERELDALELQSDKKHSKKYFQKAFTRFEKYLKDTFSLTTKGYYTKMGVGLGSAFGVVAGLVILSGFERSLGISFGIGFGMLIGVLIGRNLDDKAVAAGKML